MIFWILWIIGVVITIITRVIINELCYSTYDSIHNKKKYVQIIMHILAILCIILVGGILVAKFIGMFYNFNFFQFAALAIIPSILTYLVGWFILGLKYFKRCLSQICFLVVFIISIIGWTILISNYNRNYYKNIDISTETIIEQIQERQLLYFCNVPVQQISGKIKGYSTLGTGSVTGSISTADNLFYWYIGENTEGLYDTAPASNSHIIFIDDKKTPYVEILNYYKYTKKINYNNETTKFYDEQRWVEYNFYLPEEIMMYKLE